MITIEAVACVRKYLIAASVDRGWLGYVIIGIIARVLISSPIQAISQWLLNNVSDVPRKRLMEIIRKT